MSLFLHRLASRDLPTATAFYRDLLGMRLVGQFAMGEERKALLRFPGARRQDTTLELCETPRARQRAARFLGNEPAAGYWKIGLTVPDVAAAQSELAKRGADIGQPAQFENIGKLCHLRDPDGHTIELLQRAAPKQDSQSGGASDAGDASASVLQHATLAHVTLRCSSIERSLAFYCGSLGMRRLARVGVEAHGFALDFLAFTAEQPPSGADDGTPAALAWLWQRPYTVLELQHFGDSHPAAAHAAPKVHHGPDAAHGFLGVTFQIAEEQMQQIRSATGGDPSSRAPLELADPDGAPITVRATSA